MALNTLVCDSKRPQKFPKSRSRMLRCSTPDIGRTCLINLLNTTSLYSSFWM